MESVAVDQMKVELERMRARLLDLSARNPLLNYTHPRASSLRIVDEVPAIVLERMVSNGGFRFAGLEGDGEVEPAKATGRWRSKREGASLFDVPALPAWEEDPADPSLLSQSDRERREAARAARARREAQVAALAASLGINPSFDLPAVGDSDEARHGDRKLQTLLMPEELEARLQKMQAAAVTAIQESGANMLHLLFGFVEWTDVAGGKTRMAPLVLLPVTLSRLELDPATHTFPYTVAASGEDWSTNVTLQEKCKREFGFALPSIDEEENLEDYFARVEAVLATAAPKGWRVRRQLTLGLVSFGKILMWRDLDPNTWPADHPLLGNPLLREVLGADRDEPDAVAPQAELRTTEYNIDRLPAECGPVPPIVVPADSSQHSVLVDVQRGHSLVVQGPPGTGKSQTITNIIADAIAAGKKVLFVAEKKAALDVVARRIAQAGLGHFCLPLHSHTSNKREFLDGLQERIALGRLGDSSADLQTVEDLLDETRAALTGHAERLHAPFGALGDTAFSIFWRARRLASEMPEAVVTALRGIRLPNAVAVTPGELARQRNVLRGFAAAHTAMSRDVAPGEAHPWHGVARGDLSFDDAEALLALARDARVAAESAEAARAALGEVTEGVSWPEAAAPLTTLLEQVARLEAPGAGVPGPVVEATRRRAGEASVQAAVAATDVARRAWAMVPGPWGTPGYLSEDTLGAHRDALGAATTVYGPTRSVADAAAAAQVCARADAQLGAVETLAARLESELGLSESLTPTLASRLIEAARTAADLPDGALALRSPALAAPNAADRLTALSGRTTELLTDRTRYDERFAPAMRPSADGLRQMAGALAEAPSFWPWLFSGAYRRASAQYRRMTGGRKADRATMTADVGGLLRHLTDLEAFLRDPALEQLFGGAADGLQSPFGAASAVVAWARQTTNGVRGLGEPGRRLADAVWSCSAAAWEEAGALTLAAPASVEAASALYATLADLAAWTGSDWSALAEQAIPIVRDRLVSWRLAAVGAMDSAADAGVADATPLADLGKRLALVAQAWAADQALATHESTFHELGLGMPRTSPVDGNADVLSEVRGALSYLAQFHERGLSAALIDWLSTGDLAARLTALQTASATLASALVSAERAEARFAEAGGVDLRTWYGVAADEAPLARRVQRFERAIAAGGSLARYVTWLRQRAAVQGSPIPAAVVMLESGTVPAEQLPDTYDYLLARTLAELVLRERPELDQFSGELHETRRSQFAHLDQAFIELTQRSIAQQANRAPRIRGVGYGPVKDLTEQSLIEREIEKTRRHIPIREMFRRAGRAIQALKPCIMMGPQAVAQYLPPGLFHFDLVVMDEASQMRPEDALGAIARGSQLVVVGDPKQLGPTSFFDTQASDDDEIEEAAAQLAAEAAGAEELPRGASVLERSESILLAAARRYPTRMLRWHYRSKYPQLISFSNQEFYGGDLVLFPHPGSERPSDGVNFRAVEGALYSASINRREAQAVVEAVREHAAAHAERTLLVVTMNQAQRELVDTLIQQAEKEDPQLAAFRARHEGTLEPFGVKNLENVQGDERDVIFVSVTYGPNERGTVAQNFGPINAVGGERRLNVLFTRAKYRLDVFCSFDPTMLRVTDASPQGLCVLRDYLRYAKEGTLAGGRFTGKEPDSDFEIEVARALRAHGYDVHAQVGVAGYFLDMAVVDPHRPGRYTLAVECDGATYHSAKSARDRDRLRQGVLESLGWNVHRIWSTDWFRDPRGEVQKLLRRLDGLVGD